MGTPTEICVASTKTYNTRRSKKPAHKITNENKTQVRSRSRKSTENEKRTDPSSCSPRKIKCMAQQPTSPSSLLSSLQLEEPKIEPKRLFSNVKDSFKSVKKALHSSTPKQMIGREREIKELTEFLEEHINQNNSSSVYISGPPGTGKTATLNFILENHQFTNKFENVYLNCTSLKSSSSIFANIASQLKLKSTGNTEKDNIKCLEKYFSSNKTTLLILDELDQLESRKQSVLYTLFEWPARYKSGVILVGIANALDLTDRLLPRLQAHTSLKPKLVHFAPYHKEQIVNIIKNRLNEVGVLDSFAPVAIQMLAGKVASVSGDVRRALDISRRAVELVEQHQKRILQQKNDNSDYNSQLKIEIKDVMCVLNNVYSTSQTLNQTIEDSFPIQQKIILSSLVLILRKDKNKNVTTGRLYDIYKRVCSKRNILAVDQSEFHSLLSLIESRGMIRLTGKKDNRLQKISLEWNEEEIVAIMKDKNLMSEILNDVSCLDKK